MVIFILVVLNLLRKTKSSREHFGLYGIYCLIKHGDKIDLMLLKEDNMTDIKIAPCPCCGDSEVVTHLFGREGTKHVGIAIECESCGCGMAGDKYKTKAQIIEAWNKRTDVTK